MDYVGNKVYMKSGKSIAKLRDKLREKNLLKHAKMVEKATMEDEKIYHDLNEVDERNSYFSIVVVKEDKTGGYHD